MEKSFDRVNHDILMSRVARKIRDQRVLKLIRRYLKAGIMVDGGILNFCHYADDCHVSVGSQKKSSCKQFSGKKLKLKDSIGIKPRLCLEWVEGEN